MGLHEKWCTPCELKPTTCKHEPECSFSNWNWPLSSCCLGQRQISHSHNDTTTIPGQTSVLHLKAYLTFHSSIHRPWAVRLWAQPRLAFGWQCSELKATHGPSLVLWVTKHTSRVRNSWPVFLTHKKKLGIGDKYMALDLGSEPGQTKKRCRMEQDRWLFSSLPFQTLVFEHRMWNTHIVKCWNIYLHSGAFSIK